MKFIIPTSVFSSAMILFCFVSFRFAGLLPTDRASAVFGKKIRLKKKKKFNVGILRFIYQWGPFLGGDVEWRIQAFVHEACCCISKLKLLYSTLMQFVHQFRSLSSSFILLHGGPCPSALEHRFHLSVVSFLCRGSFGDVCVCV